jgi:phage-related protein
MKFNIKFYKTATQNPIDNYILSLEEKTQVKIGALLKRLREDPFGLKDYTRKLTKELYELKLYHSKRWVRIIYAFDQGRIIILLHGFTKKQKKTPKKEIKIAEQRLSAYKNRR